ncbi:MAG: class I mannose-6-phosphate isomerase [Bacteriovoracaceae bacterium]|jgi:mannose-6-phosphate isomerase|nr:class I mannose-6-phosphate isomerase [Bacteriovoracaceae bacterium]
MKRLCKLRPFVVSKIWGGSKLSGLKTITQTEPPIGETWEVSTLEGGCSLYDNAPLSEYFEAHQISPSDLPYLVKFIDTSDNLSVQVHPNDQYAKSHENSSGKDECWLVLAAEEGCGIYLGFKPEVSKESFFEAAANGEDVSQFLNFYPASPGDFFSVPSETIHAIGKGITLVEVQQSSGITYRVWDWNRVDESGKSRELHSKKAFDVSNFESQHNLPENFKYQRDLFNQKNKTLIEHSDFNVVVFNFNSGETYQFKVDDKRIKSLISLGGEFEVSYGEEVQAINSYESLIVIPDEKTNIEIKTNIKGALLWVY